MVTQGLAVGVDGSLGSVVGRCHRHGDKSKTGRDGNDSGARLLHELRQQGRCKADGAEEIGGNGGLGVGEVSLGKEVLRTHDAGVVDDNVEAGEVGDQLCGEGANAVGVFDVEDRGGHAWVGGGGFVKELLTAAGDDDFISQLVEGLREAAADARAAAGDENTVAGDFHSWFCLLRS